MGYSKLPNELVLEILSCGVAAWVSDASDDPAGWEEIVNLLLVCKKWNFALRAIILRKIPTLSLLRRCKCMAIMEESLGAHLETVKDKPLPADSELTQGLVRLASVASSRRLTTLLTRLLRAGVPATAKTPGKAHRCRSRSDVEQMLDRLRRGDQKGAPLIHVAVIGGSVDCVDALLEAGADIERRFRGFDETPLGSAVLTNQYRMAGTLMSYRVRLGELSTIYNGGEIAKMDLLNCAASRGNSALVRLLAELGRGSFCQTYGAKRRLTEDVISWSDAELFQFLDHRELVIKNEDTLGLAVSGGDVEIVRRILDSGVDPNQESESTGNFPLTLALNNERMDIVELLVASGAVVG